MTNNDIWDSLIILLGAMFLMACVTHAKSQTFNGNSYSLEQMQSDNNRSALELQQQQLWQLEERQQRTQQQFNDRRYDSYPLLVPDDQVYGNGRRAKNR